MENVKKYSHLNTAPIPLEHPDGLVVEIPKIRYIEYLKRDSVSKLIECDKCHELKNVFGSAHLVEEELNIKAVLCYGCTKEYEELQDRCRKEIIKKYLSDS